MKKNIHKLERILSLAAGGALVAYGLTPKVERKRFSLPSLITTLTGAGLTTTGLLFPRKRIVSTRNIFLGVVGSALILRGITGTSFLYKALGFSTRDRNLIGGVDVEHRARDRKGKKVERTILVNAPVDKVYRLWSNFENFPQWMDNIDQVRYTGADRTHWKVKSRTGVPVEFDARIKKNIPNEVISWESVSGNLPNAGSVRFDKVGDGTRVKVNMELNPLGGVIGDAIANLIGDPDKQLEDDLLNFKRVAESTTGTIEAQAQARGKTAT